MKKVVMAAKTTWTKIRKGAGFQPEGEERISQTTHVAAAPFQNVGLSTSTSLKFPRDTLVSSTTS